MALLHASQRARQQQQTPRQVESAGNQERGEGQRGQSEAAVVAVPPTGTAAAADTNPDGSLEAGG